MRLVPLVISLALLLACSKNPGGGEENGTSSGGDSEDAPFVLRCDPLAQDACATVGGDVCCSDDPLAIDLTNITALVTPQYMNGAGVGTPVFSGSNNAMGRSGYCMVEPAPASVALTEDGAQGCRTPCNPHWPVADIQAICGPAATCCQTVELQPEDCVYDSSLGDSGCFRPVVGTDIAGLGTTGLTEWAGSSHATHQDPTGIRCNAWVESIPVDELGLSADDLLIECFRRLTVADKRGSCFATSEISDCPFDDPGYIDACEQQNMENGYTGCD